MAGSGYVKIYGSILGSSVWAEALPTRIVWITMLALADENGFVEASVGGLARFANVTAKQCASALEVLMSPDTDSKSPEHEGRRIEKADRGWTILNYKTYRELRSPKQVADAERQQAYRERQRDASQTSQGIAATVDVDESVAVAVKAKDTSSSRAGWSPVLEADMADRLTTDAGRVALAGVLVVARVKSAVIAELNACLSGERGDQHRCTFAELDMALADYFAGGMSNGGTWNPNHFRACIRTAKRVPSPDIQPGRTRTQRSPDDEAAVILAAIRGLIEQNGQSRFIRREKVEAMGPKVLAAYLQLGGAERFLNVTADKLSFLQRDFAQAMRTNAA